MGPSYTSAPKKSKPSRRAPLPKGANLVVVGNGMVGAKLCERLVEAGLHQRINITVIGAEPVPAYDRIRLSSYVEHRDASRLILRDADWYDAHGITLRTGDPVTSIERPLQTVRLASGAALNYDALVLATGSRPLVPPIEGAEHPGVFLYRTLADLDAIIAAAAGKESALVIGGGLLGLEAAQAVQKLGLRATVVERAAFLMPRQLNEPAARLLEQTVSKLDLEIVLGASTTSITTEGAQLQLNFADHSSRTADFLIISAGITPNSELAAEAGLPVGLRGGIIVDGHLETEDPRILAIGECALLDGQIYGLAAPGYAMARHLVQRFQGRKISPFPKPDLSTRLKMLGADVITIGDPLEEGRRIEFQSDDVYRMLILGPRGQLKGGLGVGPWPESGRIQSLYGSAARLREKEQHYFEQEGLLSPQSTEVSVAHWPASRVVCNCMNVTKGELTNCMAQGGHDPDRIALSTGASSICGSCRPLIAELCGATPSGSKPVAVKSLLAVSALALLGVLASILMPPLAMADSVQSWWYQVDRFWRDGFIKQITGFSLLGLCLVGLLFSLRKRFGWFRFGHFARWRVFHTAFGLLALLALFVHTGFRFGHNLNFWLMLTFVGLNLLGAVAGIVSAIENSGTSRPALTARRLRPALAYGHLILFWPLPVLLTFHILSVYFY